MNETEMSENGRSRVFSVRTGRRCSPCTDQNAYKLPSIRFTVATSANIYREVTGWAKWKTRTLPPSPAHCLPLTQFLHAAVLSLSHLDHSFKE